MTLDEKIKTCTNCDYWDFTTDPRTGQDAFVCRAVSASANAATTKADAAHRIPGTPKVISHLGEGIGEITPDWCPLIPKER